MQQNSPNWRFNVPAIARAARELGLTRPIELYGANYRRWRGMHTWSPARNLHRIGVHRGASAERASRVLWHELEHARQSERDPNRQGTIARNRGRGSDAYRSDPDEIAARSAERSHERLPLTLPT